jgi:hypothetical protein
LAILARLAGRRCLAVVGRLARSHGRRGSIGCQWHISGRRFTKTFFVLPRFHANVRIVHGSTSRKRKHRKESQGSSNERPSILKKVRHPKISYRDMPLRKQSYDFILRGTSKIYLAESARENIATAE